MRWKSLLPCSILLFVGSLLPITNLSQAQSPAPGTVAVIDVGEGEAGEILLWVNSRPASTEVRTLWAFITVQNAARSNASCTQTVQVPVTTPIHGLSSITIYRDRDHGSVVVNNDEVIAVEELDKCFDDAKRVIFQVRLPRSSASNPNDGQDPVKPDEPSIPNITIVLQAVYDRATGQTAASSTSLRLGYILSQDAF